MCLILSIHSSTLLFKKVHGTVVVLHHSEGNSNSTGEGIPAVSIARSGQFNTQRFSTSFAFRIICCLRDCISDFAAVGQVSVPFSSNSSRSLVMRLSISPIFVTDSFNFSLCVALIALYFCGLYTMSNVGCSADISFAWLSRNFVYQASEF